MYRETWDGDALRAIDSRAALIRNPVRRLRYLRRVTRRGLPEIASPPVRRPWVQPVLCAVLFFSVPAGQRTEVRSAWPAPAAAWPGDLSGGVPEVWLVDKTQEFETYSNGLRIENLPAASTHARSYLAFPASDGGGEAELRTAPAGIVFHTTESQLVDFEERKTPALKRVGRYLLDYVVASRSYHFVVDRFGRVHRAVEESDAANHAGWSVWADDRWIYVNLNESFLAVAFEGRSRPDGAMPPVNAAQIHAGRVLVEMLRRRYGIAAANCVTHAQVSVNPRNLRVSYHTDWAEGFPFGSLGLPDNYARPPASLLVFGFEAGSLTAGSGMQRGLLAAEAQLQREALARRIPLAEYRRLLRARWRDALSALERHGLEKGKRL